MKAPRKPDTDDGESWSHWTTPAKVLDRLRGMGNVVLDPCWNPHAKTHPLIAADGTQLWRREDVTKPFMVPVPGTVGDGLKLNWVSVGGLVFVNPPYDAGAMALWSAHIAEQARRGCEIIPLVAARSSTLWYKTLMEARPQHILQWGPGRIGFDNPPPPVCKHCKKSKSKHFHVPLNTEAKDEALMCPLNDGEMRGTMWVESVRKPASSVESLLLYYGERQSPRLFSTRAELFRECFSGCGYFLTLE